MSVTQKSICRILDTAASRCHSVDLEPASTKQCWYLAKLMLEAGDDGSEILLNTSFLLTKKEGSKLIKFHLND
ncbi:hypothetical protein [uncultured Mediterranean phage uvMED]|nr:hypothetical protein [uncultured Mediterranean phage uvMED]BAQ84540.1 hypothetical protein [uncultured Mediterranean phage uvMED]